MSSMIYKGPLTSVGFVTFLFMKQLKMWRPVWIQFQAESHRQCREARNY